MTMIFWDRLGCGELDHEFNGASEQGEEPEVTESSLVPLLGVSGLWHQRPLGREGRAKQKRRGTKEGKGREGRGRKAMMDGGKEPSANRQPFASRVSMYPLHVYLSHATDDTKLLRATCSGQEITLFPFMLLTP